MPLWTSVDFAAVSLPLVLLRASPLPQAQPLLLRHPLPGFRVLGAIPGSGQFSYSNPLACSRWLGDRHGTQMRRMRISWSQLCHCVERSPGQSWPTGALSFLGQVVAALVLAVSLACSL